jgi:hypothetical protein
MTEWLQQLESKTKASILGKDFNFI